MGRSPTPRPPRRSSTAPWWSRSIIGLIQLLIVQPFLVAAVAKASADVYLGHTVVVGPTFRFAVSRIHSILWISILMVLIIFVPVFVSADRGPRERRVAIVLLSC